MRPFHYERVSEPVKAIAIRAVAPNGRYLAGGTDLLTLMKDGVECPDHLIDINDLPFRHIELDSDELRIGALARLSDVADAELVRREYPLLTQSIEAAASAQVRNAASIGGNLLQRTRCPYFRSETVVPCNKRTPGSGCSAIRGDQRTLAVVGTSAVCSAAHPSDLAVALVALDAHVRLEGAGSTRTVALRQFYQTPDTAPDQDTILRPGELIVEIVVPRLDPRTVGHYAKVRDRASFSFALVSAAVVLRRDGDQMRNVRIALGGVAPMPWRLPAVERALEGTGLDLRGVAGALETILADARPLPGNQFKVSLARAVVHRALQLAAGAA